MSHSSTVLIPTIMSGLRDWSRLWRGWLTKPLLTAALFRTHQTKSIDSIHAFITVASTTFMSFSTLPVNLCCLLPLILVVFFQQITTHNIFFLPAFYRENEAQQKPLHIQLSQPYLDHILNDHFYSCPPHTPSPLAPPAVFSKCNFLHTKVHLS